MAETLTPDICVVGGGSGAAAVVIAAAAFGVPAVLVERRQLAGRESAGVPTLLAAARHAQAIRAGAAFGVTSVKIDIDFAKVRDHVTRVAASLARNEQSARLTGFGVRLIEGEARFKDQRTIAVSDLYEIRARRFVIATRSVPVLPLIPGLDQELCFTSETIFGLTELPQHLIVIGAGATGLELAQAFRRLGSEVTVLEEEQPLAGGDAEAAAIIVNQLEREGVVIRGGVKVAAIEHNGGTVRAILEGNESVEGSHLLVTVGRKPMFDGLDLKAAGISFDDSGIAVNKALKTSNKRVYAIGGVTGQKHFGHAANHHAGLVIQNALFHRRVSASIDAISSVILTEPELAQVGLTESEARRRRIKIRISRWPYHDNVRAQAESETRGHIKVMTTDNGKIIGVTIVGARAGELIAMWALAIVQGLKISALTDVVLPAPTLSEIGKSAALDYFSPRLTSPWLRRIIVWLRLFG